ncbi:MAG: YggS family pyridoxal phosphate-dependent enzyme [Tepidiformaceae bacterium]
MSVSPEPGLADRIAEVRERIESACQRAGRDSATVTLIAVTKTWPAPAVVVAMERGLFDFGENRVQEAIPKMDLVRELCSDGVQPAWHFIGHLQSNKVKSISGRFAILHGVDSERLLEGVARSAAQPQRIMLEVNVAGEASKFGIPPTEVGRLVDAAARCPNVVVQGLMTVAPQGQPDAARAVFRRLRALGKTHALPSLSMGMSDDFEIAIEEGATHIRVGRAIFGARS